MESTPFLNPLDRRPPSSRLTAAMRKGTVGYLELARILERNFNELNNVPDAAIAQILRQPNRYRPSTESRQFRVKHVSMSKRVVKPSMNMETPKTNEPENETADLSNKLAKFIENVLRQKAQHLQKGRVPVYNVHPLPLLNADKDVFRKPPVPKANVEGKRKFTKTLYNPRNAARNELGLKLPADEDRDKEGERRELGDEGKKSAIEDYALGNQIGHGAYAIVRSGIHKTSGRRVAVKIYEKYKLVSSQRKNCVDREIKLLRKLDHPNIVKLYETIDEQKQLFLVMELVRGRSLLTYIKSRSGRKLEEPECLRIFRQVLAGICFCHKHNVVHRDIKMENVLLDEQFNVKIIDFGFSTWTTPTQKLKIYCGTPSYMSPEIVGKKEYYGPPADMWSLGVLLFVMLCGCFPFRGTTELELYRNISKGLYSIPSHVSPGARRVICRLLHLDPQRRPTAEEISKDALLSGLGTATATNSILFANPIST